MAYKCQGFCMQRHNCQVSQCIESRASPKQISEPTLASLKVTVVLSGDISLPFLLNSYTLHTPEILTRKYALFCLQHLILIYL